MTSITWQTNPVGDYLSNDGRWRLRKVSFGRGAGHPTRYWLYRDGSRFTPTGAFDDGLSFVSLVKAKRFVADFSATSQMES